MDVNDAAAVTPEHVYQLDRATARGRSKPFVDYFFERAVDTTLFVRSKPEIFGDPTRMLYLRGALHLVRAVGNETHKISHAHGSAILDRFGRVELAVGVENQYLAVPRELVLTLPPELQELLGYNMWGNLVGNVDGRHPRRWLERQQ